MEQDKKITADTAEQPETPDTEETPADESISASDAEEASSGTVNSDEISDTPADSEESVETAETAPAPAPSLYDKLSGICKSGVKTLNKFGIPDMALLRFMAVYFFFTALDIASLKKDKINAISAWREYVPKVDGLKTILLMTGAFIVISLIWSLLPKKLRIIDQTLSIASIMYFDYIVLWNNGNDKKYYISFSVMLISIVFIWYALGKMRRCTLFNRAPQWVSWAAVLLAAGAVCYFVAVTTVYRHKNFGTASHDFGLFVQMYHSLAEHMTAVTTCERDVEKSHFLIHASYIFYFLAPVYKMFPKPETLLIAQAILAMGGIIPMMLIAKNHKIKGLSMAFMGMAYVFCCGLIGPNYYEFHENCFLPTLLMWLIWAMDTRRIVPAYIFSALVCIVKEDAPLYVICIMMLMFFEEKTIKRMHGLIISLFSGAYMMFITNWLTANGDGQFMTSTRFGLLMIDQSGGLKEVVKNVLIDPAYFFSLFVHEETQMFFMEVMLPLLFLPFFTKKISRYLLMLPFIIMNMVIGAGYGYAANIGFQYIYGPVCLLIYMSILNLDDMGKERKQELPVLMGIASMILSVGLFSHNINNIKGFEENKEYFTELSQTLSGIPSDASVAADTFFCSHTANRDQLYVFDNNDVNIDEGTVKEPERYDFIAISVFAEYYEDVAADLAAHGYTEYANVHDKAKIYVSPTYTVD